MCVCAFIWGEKSTWMTSDTTLKNNPKILAASLGLEPFDHQHIHVMNKCYMNRRYSFPASLAHQKNPIFVINYYSNIIYIIFVIIIQTFWPQTQSLWRDTWLETWEQRFEVYLSYLHLSSDIQSITSGKCNTLTRLHWSTFTCDTLNTLWWQSILLLQ